MKWHHVMTNIDPANPLGFIERCGGCDPAGNAYWLYLGISSLKRARIPIFVYFVLWKFESVALHTRPNSS